MRHYKIEAIVLKRINLGETDRLVTFFTKEKGKKAAIARGVRKITSRRAAHLEVFNHVKAALYQGRGLDTIVEVETLETFSQMRSKLSCASTAFFLIEEVEHLCPENYKNSRVFEMLIGAFVKLNKEYFSYKELGKLREEFSQVILKELGFLPKKHCISGKSLYHFLEEVIQRKMKSTQLISRSTV